MHKNKNCYTEKTHKILDMKDTCLDVSEYFVYMYVYIPACCISVSGNISSSGCAGRCETSLGPGGERGSGQQGTMYQTHNHQSGPRERGKVLLLVL